jgi:hypothetical protein
VFGLQINKDGTVLQRASWIEGDYEFQRSKRLYTPPQRIYFSAAGDSEVEARWSMKLLQPRST